MFRCSMRSCERSRTSEAVSSYKRLVDAERRTCTSERFFFAWMNTFFSRALEAFLYQKKKRTIMVASTGIAATLLRNGSTAHSRFKLPLNLDKDSKSFVSHYCSFLCETHHSDDAGEQGGRLFETSEAHHLRRGDDE